MISNESANAAQYSQTVDMEYTTWFKRYKSLDGTQEHGYFLASLVISDSTVTSLVFN